MRDTDRRVIYTKKLLRDSLMALMEEKPISRISVTELCKGAGVNRGTFYSHYREPEDVLRNIEEDLVSNVSDILDNLSDTSEIYHAVTQALYRNRDACRLLISPNGDPNCIKHMLELSTRYFAKHTQSALNTDPAALRYMHAFMFAGTVAVLEEWLTKDPGRTPEEIAEIIINMKTKLLNNI